MHGVLACCVGRLGCGVCRLRPPHAAAAMITVAAERTYFILRALGEQGAERGTGEGFVAGARALRKVTGSTGRGCSASRRR